MWIICKRYNALQQTTLFQGMKFSTDHAQIKQWAPLVMEGREGSRWRPPGRRWVPPSTGDAAN
jgi:L-2-hydroxyglutarate oxidase LhgO